jgi:hypothetical protein
VLEHRRLRELPIDLEAPWCVLLDFTPGTFDAAVTNSDHIASNGKIKFKSKSIPVTGRGGP